MTLKDQIQDYQILKGYIWQRGLGHMLLLNTNRKSYIIQSNCAIRINLEWPCDLNVKVAQILNGYIL